MDANKLFVRTASVADIGLIYGMICSLENTTIDREGFDMAFKKNVAADHIVYFIAELNHEPVGMASCHIQPLLHHGALVAEIQEMFVEQQNRSQRVGHVLMERVVQHARDQGAVQLEVTSRDTRENAHRFYQREGFDKSHVKLVRYFR